MTDEQFVRDAAKRWDATLDFVNDPKRDGTTGAVAVALFATLNMDRLLKIAAARTKGGAA